MTTENRQSPTAIGRKWFYWAALVVVVSTVPRYLTKFDINAIAVLVLNLVVFGGGAFVAGWLYGKHRQK